MGKQLRFMDLCEAEKKRSNCTATRAISRAMDADRAINELPSDQDKLLFAEVWKRLPHHSLKTSEKWTSPKTSSARRAADKLMERYMDLNNKALGTQRRYPL